MKGVAGADSPPTSSGTFKGRMATGPLESFTPQVREWFARSFEAPTPAQDQAWPAIAGG